MGPFLLASYATNKVCQVGLRRSTPFWNTISNHTARCKNTCVEPREHLRCFHVEFNDHNGGSKHFITSPHSIVRHPSQLTDVGGNRCSLERHAIGLPPTKSHNLTVGWALVHNGPRGTSTKSDCMPSPMLVRRQTNRRREVGFRFHPPMPHTTVLATYSANNTEHRLSSQIHACLAHHLPLVNHRNRTSWWNRTAPELMPFDDISVMWRQVLW